MFLLKNNNKDTDRYKEFVIKILISIGVVLGGYIIYLISDILNLLFFSFFITILFSPFLDKLNKYKIWDWLWIIIIYLFLLSILILVFFSIVPIFVDQITTLINVLYDKITLLSDAYRLKWLDWLGLPDYIINHMKWILQYVDLNNVFDVLKNHFSSIWSFIITNLSSIAFSWAWLVSSVTSWLFNIIMIIIFTFFIVLERKNIRKIFYEVLPKNTSLYLKKREGDIVHNLYHWLKWQLILSLSMFTLSFLWLNLIRLFGIDLGQNFKLAFISGAMEFIPYIWPILAFLPAIAIAIWISFKAFLVVIILYIIMQQIENNLLVPWIMSKTLSISPFFVFLTMTIWASIYGIIGIVLAIPITSVIQIFVRDWLEKKNNNNN
jgi:predicted PurR-regulated permease PerM